MSTPRFTREEMHEDLQRAILLFARSASWVLDMSAGYRVLNLREPSAPGSGCLNDLEQFDLKAPFAEAGEPFDLSRFEVARTFDDFYDYGVLATRRMPLGNMTPASSVSFAFAFISDIADSKLLGEMWDPSLNGFPRCFHTARLAQARAILDGGERFFDESGDMPTDLLTFGEVALLAELEEGSVRNAASGKRPSLRATRREHKSFVSPANALKWLKDRKGFVPTRVHGHLVDVDLRNRAFRSLAEVNHFLDEHRANRGLSYADYRLALGLPSPEYSRFDFLDESNVPETPAQITALSALFDLDPELFALRVEEARLASKAAAVRDSIESITRRLDR